MEGLQHQQSSVLERQLVQTLLDEVWPRLSWSAPSKNALVIGCATGETMCLDLLPRMPQDVFIVAGDGRQEMINECVARFPFDNVGFIVVDFGTPDIQATQAWNLVPYTKIFSFFYLQSIRDQNQVMENIYKLLVDGGEAFIVMIIYTAVDSLYLALSRADYWNLYVQDYRHFVTPYQLLDDPADVLRGFLEDAGLQIINVECREVNFSSQNINVIREGVRATNLFHSRLPPAVQLSYWEDCISEVRSNGKLILPHPNDAMYHYRYNALIAHVMKP
ncbi:juvenile hormone acid O-methyltransferase-like [Schistocerca cancellata]|uniref:juvenile hormone acid O-methyltransferase-like n=1 Tax=Schistocerca cancellata TaxID=274614 RepID=UPI002118BEDF|nr:juvenile hormone acid O-methyltransferase-like [Schistocerca cancellata]